MELIKKFKILNDKVCRLDLKREKLIEQIQEMEDEIKNYLHDESNSLEDRFIFFNNLPEEMLNQYFVYNDKNCPKSFKYVIEGLQETYGYNIKDVKCHFSEWFYPYQKKIDYEGFSRERMNGWYDEDNIEEIKKVTDEAFNYLIKNMIGSI